MVKSYKLPALRQISTRDVMCNMITIVNTAVLYIRKLWGFLGGTVVENLTANAGDTGSSPGLGRSHMPRSI